MPTPKRIRTIPPPPDDLAALCRATIPVAPKARALSAPRRALLIGGALALALGVVELTRPLYIPQATPSASSGIAFAETVRAMQRVAFFHRTGTGLDFETTPRWKYLSTTFANDEWFDMQRGLYERMQHSRIPISGTESEFNYGTLTLPNGQLYIRSGADVMIHDNSQRARWSEVKKNKFREITEPASFGGGIGSGLKREALKMPSAFRATMWKGQPATCFAFLAAPVKETVDPHQSATERAEMHEFWQMVVPPDAPTLRSEVYVDPETHRVRAVRKYARFPSHPEVSERLICEYEYEYDHRPDSGLFRPQIILAGAKEIEDFRGSSSKYVPRTVWRAHSK